jgi:hypothetical protein
MVCRKPHRGNYIFHIEETKRIGPDHGRYIGSSAAVGDQVVGVWNIYPVIA